jgi:hypothetical protein
MVLRGTDHWRDFVTYVHCNASILDSGGWAVGTEVFLHRWWQGSLLA